MKTSPIAVRVFTEHCGQSEAWVAQAVDYHLSAAGRTPQEAIESMRKSLTCANRLGTKGYQVMKKRAQSLVQEVTQPTPVEVENGRGEDRSRVCEEEAPYIEFSYELEPA